MDKYKIILIAALIAALSLTACGSIADTLDSNITEVSVEDRVSIDFYSTEDMVTGDTSTMSIPKESDEERDDEPDTSENVEESLEGGIVTQETQSSTKVTINSSLGSNTKVTEGDITTEEYISSIKSSESDTGSTLQPETQAPQPTEALQPETQAPQPTEASQPETQTPQSTEALQPVTQAKPAYNPEYVIAEATKRLKELGYRHMPDVLDEALAEGRITQAEYDEWYPLCSDSWFGCSLWNVRFGGGMEDDINELVENCKYLCVDGCFYIEYNGVDEFGDHEYICYR